MFFAPITLTVVELEMSSQLLPPSTEYSKSSTSDTLSPVPSLDFLKTAAEEFLSDSETIGATGRLGTIKCRINPWLLARCEYRAVFGGWLKRSQK